MSRKSVQEIWDEQDEEMLYLWARNIELKAINDFIMGPGLLTLLESLHVYTMTMGLSPRIIGPFDALREPEKARHVEWIMAERRRPLTKARQRRLKKLEKAARTLPRNPFDAINDREGK
jgi:hypothetical protein